MLRLGTVLPLTVVAAGLAVIPAATDTVVHATPGDPGMIVVTDTAARRIQVFHADGTFAFAFGLEGNGSKHFHPEGVAVGPDGRIVVADRGLNERIHIFHPNGTLAFGFGSVGSNSGQFVGAHDVAVGPDGRIVVADIFNKRFQVFDPNGTFVFERSVYGGFAGHVDAPSSVAVGPDGRIVVADTFSHPLQVYHPNGTLAFGFGSVGNSSGQFVTGSPHAIAVGPDGRIVVADRGLGFTNFIQVYHPNGTFDFAVKPPPQYPNGGFNPTDVTVGSDGSIIAVDGAGAYVFHSDGTFAFAFAFEFHGHGGDFVGHYGVAAGPMPPPGPAPPGAPSAWFSAPPPTHAPPPPPPPPPTVEPHAGCGEASSDPCLPTAPFLPEPMLEPVQYCFGRPMPSLPDGRSYRCGVGAGPAETVGPGAIVVGKIEFGRFQTFHPNGTFAFGFGAPGTDGFGTPGNNWFKPTAVAVGSDGRIVALDGEADGIHVFHPNGTFALAFAPDDEGADGLLYPLDVAAGPDGRIVVVGGGSHKRIHVFHPNGTFDFAVGPPHYADGGSRLTSVAAGPDGQIVVGDAASARIRVYQADGTFDFDFEVVNGSSGTRFPDSGGVAVGPDGRIVAIPIHADPTNRPIQAFHPNGTFDFAFGSDGNGGDDGWLRDVDVGPDGRIVVSDMGRELIKAFHPNGTLDFAIEYRGIVDTEALRYLHPVAVSPVPLGPTRLGVSSLADLQFAPHFFADGGSRGRDGQLADQCDGPALESGLSVCIAERYVAGSMINISGAVRNANHTLLHDVSILVMNPTGNIVDIHQATPDDDSKFSASIVADGQRWSMAGKYEVHVQHSSDKARATFTFFSDGSNHSSAEQEPTILPPLETSVYAPFATVSFPPGVTAYAPADWSLGLRISTRALDDNRVQEALAYYGPGHVSLQRIIEVGSGQARVTFDMPIRILLEGQAGGRTFYINDGGGEIVPIDMACAVDDTARVHRQLGGAGECQMDSGDGSKIVYTYHLTRFGTVQPEHAVSPPSIHTCSIRLGSPSLDVHVRPGEYSPPVRQALINSGSLPLAHADLVVTSWHTSPGGGAQADVAPPPMSIIEMSTGGQGGTYTSLVNETGVAHGLGGGDVAPLWFRLNLTSYGEAQGTTLVQHTAYQATCSQ